MRRLSSEHVPPRERMAFVHDFVARHIGGLHFSPADRDNIRIDLEGLMLPGGLTIGRSFYAPMRGARTRDLLQDGREHYLMAINSEDHEIAVEGKAPVKIAAGDAILLNEAGCSEFWLGKATRVDVIALDRRLLAGLAPRIPMEANYIIPSKAPSMSLLVDYVEALRRNPPVSLKAGELASRHVYDLAALVLDGFVRGGAERNAHSIAAARLKLIQKDIVARIADPDLRIEAVARRQGVTPRYIQRLFESDGTTFSDFVREQRLDLAFCLLRARERAGSTITAIAYDAGFSDVSSFNRAFRRRFNATPSDVRATILAG
ncbi:UNVERIFIED_ORG: helix-turn-helix transcriptional regulator (plasmid) [Roseateles sp. XES5]|nr:AraC family transcriptional regulator [Roseateles sp. XES5]